MDPVYPGWVKVFSFPFAFPFTHSTSTGHVPESSFPDDPPEDVLLLHGGGLGAALAHQGVLVVGAWCYTSTQGWCSSLVQRLLESKMRSGAHSGTYSNKSLLMQILPLSLKVLDKTDNR